jgi:alpha-beta hydrolase superfamily lysophospholipase
VSDAAPPPQPDFGTVAAADGVPLFVQHWPAEAPRAVLLVVHGLGEHGGRYAALARDLVGRGISVFAMDLRGHGRSGGPRAYARRFEVLVDDVERVRLFVVARSAGLPVFLLGHSLGGLICIRHLQAHPEAFRGAVLSAPLLGVAVKAARWKVAASGVLSRVVPWLPISNEIRPEELSSDPAYIRSYREDPLVHTKITPRLYTELMAHIGRAAEDAGRLPHPLFFIAPTADTVVDAEAVRRFVEGLAGDVTYRRYEGFRHESLNERERDRVVTDVAGWMDGVLRG